MDFLIDIKKTCEQFRIEGLRLGDNGFRTFRFHFCEGASPFPIPESCIATLYALLPDEEETCVYSSCTTEGSTVIYELCGSDGLTPAITSAVGLVKCELRLTAADGAVLTSPRFSILIEPTLQQDGAIEAQPSFSALTDALARVLTAENGLAAKVDKVAGAAGNTVVFGEEGMIADSGTCPVDTFIIYHDDSGSHATENCAAMKALRTLTRENKPFNLVMDLDGIICPAQLEYSSTVRLVAKADYKGINYVITYTDSRESVSYADYDNVADTFSETGKTPATQAATAEWVKSLIEASITEGAW